ncbi:sugar transferase [Funiculus sociatus GB2-A5]|uniref:Sugar transferase n=1 Tax=Funiculus sociatus GB2-A5 TaxID=2933946 RepID=A0ABV0JPJ0_9CYAN|nr:MULTISPECIES: Npun_R2821/Npun_R2822 family protein [unclassified Trichocoleus]MBD1907542.1 sugar transferase [Trichocoleus sp. FACHB-832]MBD2062132.1 sugar transferase [Trichocoleus sp. FACHB-6]
MTNGIYTFANDMVYDQLVALLNSIELNAGKEIPVCVIPYNTQLDKIRAEVAARKNVTLFDDAASIAFWEDFITQAWKAHKTAQKVWHKKGWPEVRRVNFVRKLCSFDGAFDKFIYMDADTLLMGPIEQIYQKLDNYEWVVNDFQYKSDMDYIFNPEAEKLIEKTIGLEKAKSQIFCAGWFASKKGVFNSVELADLLEKLKAGEAEVMSLRGSDQPLYNYLVSRSGISYYNFAYHDLEQATGSHWSSKFDVVDHVLYDKGRRLTYIHYMSIASSEFTQLCAGEDINIPYRDVFLHYRYLKSPEERPKLVRPSLLVRAQRNAKSFVSQNIGKIRSKLVSTGVLKRAN